MSKCPLRVAATWKASGSVLWPGLCGLAPLALRFPQLSVCGLAGLPRLQIQAGLHLFQSGGFYSIPVQQLQDVESSGESPGCLCLPLGAGLSCPHDRGSGSSSHRGHSLLFVGRDLSTRVWGLSMLLYCHQKDHVIMGPFSVYHFAELNQLVFEC